MTVAKALTGGVSGIGAVLMTEAVAQSLSDDGNCYSTYGWHPRSTAVAIATMRYLIRRRRPLMRAVMRTSDYFRSRILEMPFGEMPAVRVEGLAIAIDVGDEDRAEEIAGRCRRNGLLISTDETLLLLLPALNIDRATARRGLDILSRAVRH
jgi:acetylornithine/succinyldiaminopimelate/putrescine aminotransferase